MKAMILAAGEGTRMRPLTLHTPKPLLQVTGKSLIEYHIEKLVAVGIKELVINHAYLGAQIESYLGDGARWGACIQYSREGTPLETAGGIVKALPLLGTEPFIVINGDVWSDYDFGALTKIHLTERLAHLVLIDNPPHHLQGDFFLSQNHYVYAHIDEALTAKSLTFAGISVLSPRLFKEEQYVGTGLGNILRGVMHDHQVSGEHFAGMWVDVGTPERLAELNQTLKQKYLNVKN